MPRKSSSVSPSRSSAPSRFNPGPGLSDLWTEIRRPHPFRWPILAASVLPAAGILGWALDQEYYVPPEQPQITYITTLGDGRSDAAIQAENRANQQIKDLRAAEQTRIAGEKREIYKALGAAAGMDVDEMERKADAERAAAEAAEAGRLKQAGAGASASAKTAESGGR